MNIYCYDFYFKYIFYALDEDKNGDCVVINK